MQIAHRFFIAARLGYQFDSEGWLLINVAAMQGSSQRVLGESISTDCGIAPTPVGSGEGCTRFHAISAPAGAITIEYTAEVERVFAPAPVHMPAEARLVDLPPEVIPYLYPSRYCESDKLARFAAKTFGGLSPGHERAAGICNWLYEQIEYLPGTTDAHTSAVECLTRRAGVCRDFAHLGISLCRALGIPARYASGYAFDLAPADFHAFFEVWLGGQWWVYDATRLAPQHGFIKTGHGKDAADTSVATFSGAVRISLMDISVQKRTPGPVEYAAGPVAA
jgi:transglutaminase-like putative cysteine protease